jgi:hypothetical protein
MNTEYKASPALHGEFKSAWAYGHFRTALVHGEFSTALASVVILGNTVSISSFT